MATVSRNHIQQEARILGNEALSHLADARRYKAAGDTKQWQEHMIQAVEFAVAGMCLAIDPEYYARNPVFQAAHRKNIWTKPSF